MQSSQSGTLESTTVAHSSTWSRSNPYSATVLENRLLTGSDSEKETRHIELDLGDSGITYLPGDSAGILPINACDAVDLVLERLQLTGTEPVTDFYGKPLDLRQALTSWLMIGKVSGSTLKAWAKHTGHAELSDIAANREKLDAYLWGREFLDLLEHAPAKLDDPQQLFKILPRLAPRLYSISSSQALLGTQIDLSIRVVKYETHGRNRHGVCSTHVGERTPKGEKLPIFIHSNQLFRLPTDPNTRVIMVGPGTGVAPFRAFLQHKQAGVGRWPMWLFFGDQRASQDFLYKEDFEAWVANGILNRLDTAFSRDQKEKIYVQTRIRQNSAELYRWLSEGAYFYVCGDSKRMAPDVEAALLEAVATHSGKGPEYANEFLAEMKKQKRYLRDVY